MKAATGQRPLQAKLSLFSCELVATDNAVIGTNRRAKS
jgi:hypothetical protein